LAAVPAGVALILVIFAITTFIEYTTPIASAQDLNPPTTGRTTPNVTSTFGINTTAPNGGISNSSQENVTK
jgi:hypothetical protein